MVRAQRLGLEGMGACTRFGAKRRDGSRSPTSRPGRWDWVVPREWRCAGPQGWLYTNRSGDAKYVSIFFDY
jgi:hypothetical protein